MSAVIENVARDARALPLLCDSPQGRIVAWHGGRAIDVAEFLADVATVANALPVGRDAVNLCDDRYAFLVAFCAIACAGRTNLLPPSRTRAAIDETLAAFPGSYALGDAPMHPAPDGHVLLPSLGGSRNAIDAVPLIAADHVAAIGFTSGSTGHPKANPKTWGSFTGSNACNVSALLAVLGDTPELVGHIVATVPPQHMYGIELSILLPLLGPFAVHSARPLFPADVARALADVPEPRVLVTTPVHLRALLRDPQALPALAAITSATAPLSAELAAEAEARYGAPVLEMFGSTETCVIAQRRTAMADDWCLYADVCLKPQPDGTLVDAPWFSQPVILQDVVELLPGHAFRLRGRHADLVEIAGKRASLADLTRRLLAVPGVHDAVVLQLDEADSMGVCRIAALVVAPDLTEALLLGELRRSVDPAFLPRPLRKVDALPRNDTGKLPRSALIDALYR